MTFTKRQLNGFNMDDVKKARYILYDHREDYGIIGICDTKHDADVIMYCRHRVIDGDCDLELIHNISAEHFKDDELMKGVIKC